jgi:hypothetical protein
LCDEEPVTIDFDQWRKLARHRDSAARQNSGRVNGKLLNILGAIAAIVMGGATLAMLIVWIRSLNK